MAQASASVKFIVDGSLIEAKDIAATTTLLDYLREQGGCAKARAQSGGEGAGTQPAFLPAAMEEGRDSDAVFHPQPEIAALMAERLHDHVHQLLDHPHS